MQLHIQNMNMRNVSSQSLCGNTGMTQTMGGGMMGNMRMGHHVTPLWRPQFTPMNVIKQRPLLAPLQPQMMTNIPVQNYNVFNMQRQMMQTNNPYGMQYRNTNM